MSSSLLPNSFSQFHDKQYWDDFFKERGNKAFEWYGSYHEFSEFIYSRINPPDSILVIGCGNSDFSSQLYDNCYHNITNVDFSDLVINEMRNKNRNRTNMSWLAADMTNMNDISHLSFNHVFDKGALDALLSENKVEILAKATQMFNEIDRVLTCNGTYMCISLAQDFVIKAFLSFFQPAKPSQLLHQSRWKVQIEVIKSNTRSPYKPFFITATKLASSKNNSSLLQLKFDSFGLPIDDFVPSTVDEALKLIKSLQEYQMHSFELAELHPGRFEFIDFWVKSNNSSPRFSITIVDQDCNASANTQTCAVLILPPGRESEYQFSTQRGLLEIAAQVQCLRLLTVRLNKPHTFSVMSQLQEELSPIIMTLVPNKFDSTQEKIPYLTLGSDNDWTEVEYGFSTVSGDFIVEQKADTEHAQCGAIFRRLIFVQNQNFIQTESRLLPKTQTMSGSTLNSITEDNATMSKSKIKRLKKKRSIAKKNQSNANGSIASGSICEHDANTETAKHIDIEEQNVSESLYLFDLTYMDDHHKAVLASFVLTPDIILNCSTVNSSTCTGMVVGLGGGAMSMCLQHYLPRMRLILCDLDDGMEEIAKRHFGFVKSSTTRTVVGDGLEVMKRIVDKLEYKNNSQVELNTLTTTESLQNLELNNVDLDSDINRDSSVNFCENISQEYLVPLSFLFIDVDGKDTSLGLTAPPESFITDTALQLMFNLLSAGGMLAINVVARGGKEPVDALVIKLKSIFECNSADFNAGSIFMIKPSDETVNTILIAIKGFSKLPLHAQRGLEESESIPGITNHEYREVEYEVEEENYILQSDVKATSVGEHTCSKSKSKSKKTTKDARLANSHGGLTGRNDTLNAWLSNCNSKEAALDSLGLFDFIGKISML